MEIQGVLNLSTKLKKQSVPKVSVMIKSYFSLDLANSWNYNKRNYPVFKRIKYTERSKCIIFLPVVCAIDFCTVQLLP